MSPLGVSIWGVRKGDRMLLQIGPCVCFRVCKNDVLTATGELEEAVFAGEVRVD